MLSWICLAAAGCTVDRVERELGTVRLDLLPGAVKAVALGSGVSAAAQVPDRLGLPRNAAALLLVAESDGARFLVDAAPGVAELLRARIREPSPQGSKRPIVDGLLLTQVTAEQVEGIIELARETSAPLPVFGSADAFAQLFAELRERSLEPDRHLEARPLLPGQSLHLSNALRVTALESPRPDGGSYFAYRFQGSSRSLLYAPAIGSRASLEAIVKNHLPTLDVVLLDGRRFDAREAPPPGLEARSHPPIEECLELLRRERARGFVLRFTRLAPQSAVLDPEGYAWQLLRDHGADLLEDGSEYWL